jgi:mono/diheme cytochrome c family protein
MLRSLLCLLFLFSLSPSAFAKGDVEKGKYILNMGGCISCHKAPKLKDADLAGGHALKTPFGTFYVPNITPDVETGIGGWSEGDFINAMTQGVAPDGSHYYPAFPYTSYTKIKRDDLIDLKAYLDSIPPVRNAVPDHDLGFPFNMRILMIGWKMMFFDEGPFKEDTSQSASWNRGAYIVNSASHCAECHTPRNIFGGLDQSKMFQGNPKLDKEKVPSLITKWDDKELYTALKMGMTPEGDFLGGSMGHVISRTTSKLSKSDLEDVVGYIKSLH